MLRFIGSFMNGLSDMMSVNSRQIIVVILAISTIATTITIQSINIHFILAFLFISASLYLPEIYRFIVRSMT